jgi:protocatechuate 3,4-dioxygenase beta subunit
MVTLMPVSTQPAQTPSQLQAASARVPPVFTDSDGKFIINDIPPGQYRLYAAHNGFNRQEYGEHSLRGAGIVVSLQAGQVMRDLVFRLTPAGTITGRVLDAAGEPAVGVIVQAMVSIYTANGQKMLGTVFQSRTDDLGQYRLHSLTPGPFYLSALTPSEYVQDILQEQAGAAAYASNRNNPGPAESVADFLESMLGIGPNNVFQPDLALTYYPGTTDRLKAAPIEVRPGMESHADDIRIIAEKNYRVRGRILDPRTRERPLRATIQMVRKQTLGSVVPMSAKYDALNGVFELPHVPPGEYLLVVLAPSVLGPPGVAEETMTVSSNIDDIVLTARPGQPIKGKVSSDDGKPLSALPELLRMQVALIPASEMLLKGGESAPLQADGSFTLENVFSGEYRVAMPLLPANAYIKQALFGQTDLLEVNASINSGTTESLEIVIGRSGGQISGTLVDKNSKPQPNVQVLLIPDRHRDWRELIKRSITDQAGKFTIQGIAPGDYKIYAWEDIEPLAFTDLEILRQYEGQAKSVKVTEQSKQTIEVKIIPAAP